MGRCEVYDVGRSFQLQCKERKLTKLFQLPFSHVREEERRRQGGRLSLSSGDGRYRRLRMRRMANVNVVVKVTRTGTTGRSRGGNCRRGSWGSDDCLLGRS